MLKYGFFGIMIRHFLFKNIFGIILIGYGEMKIMWIPDPLSFVMGFCFCLFLLCIIDR